MAEYTPSLFVISNRYIDSRGPLTSEQEATDQFNRWRELDRREMAEQVISWIEQEWHEEYPDARAYFGVQTSTDVCPSCGDPVDPGEAVDVSDGSTRHADCADGLVSDDAGRA